MNLSMKQPFLQLVYLGAMMSLLYISYFPGDSAFAQKIAAESLSIMFGLFLVGGIFLFLKRPYLMLQSWLACMSFCYFLKGSSDSFYYASAQQQQPVFQLLQLDLKAVLPEEKTVLLDQLSHLQADLIYLQADQSADACLSEIEKKYSHKYELETKNSWVYSQRPLIIDSSNWTFAPLLIDTQAQIRLLCLPQNKKESLNSNKIQQLSKQSAFIGPAPLFVVSWSRDLPWSEELRNLRQNLELEDSRLDINWQTEGQHIFHSKELRCLELSSPIEARSLFGRYQMQKTTAPSAASYL
ncbi:hypothetical protein SapgrDRAFT_2552 [Saprospira grandis DSM 2844]|uniref:Uncharacterized protein n=1 Tax=Saprospira grandis DSM 2844 TaxID=694433 RepID=J0XYJ6_9BACT|nr:hypothetical protein [Saprospira grandis]EJF54211.1 hypothetical protein SapgrDRAFT_2552 [Saprospira grandis DSM 2844]